MVWLYYLNIGLNDSEIIPTMVIRVVQALTEVTDDYEAIVMNDGSSDDPGRIPEEIARHYPQLRVMHHDLPSRYEGVLRPVSKKSSIALLLLAHCQWR